MLPIDARHASLSENIYRKLLRRIIDGKITAGSRMREEKLCEELGVSRTPLREALIRLVREGILEQQPRRGCVVRQMADNEIAQLLECRRLLECLALREWFGRIDRQEIERLAVKLGAIATADGETARKELLAVDEALHEAIVVACGNAFLSTEIRRLQLLCRPYRVLRCAESGDLELILKERRRIVDAILRNDITAADAAMAAHFEDSARYYKANGLDR